jgi:hypothetical protein
VNYLFKPPGWSHDGSKKTSSQLRNDVYWKLVHCSLFFYWHCY